MQSAPIEAALEGGTILSRIGNRWSIDLHNWGLLAVLLLGTALALHQLAADGLWADEIITATYVQEPSFSAVLDKSVGFNDRPLHLAIVYLLTFAGQDEFWLRFPSVLCGVLSLAVTYKIGRFLFGRREGLLAALLLALAPLQLHYSQELRSYALLMCLSLFSLYFLLRAWRSGYWVWWLGFVAASVLNLYTHYASVLVLVTELAACGLLFLGEAVAMRSTDQPQRIAWKRRQRERFLALSLSILAIGLSLLPSLAHLTAYVGPQVGGGPGTKKFGLTFSFLAEVLNQLSVEAKVEEPVAARSWLFLGFFFLGVFASVRQRQYRSLLWVLVWIAMPFLILFLIPSQHFFVARHIIFVLPLFLLAVSRGVTALADGLRWLLSRWMPGTRLRTWPTFLFVTLVVVGLGVAPLVAYYERPKEGWRDAAAYLRAHLQPGDLVICDSIHYQKNGDSARPYAALRYYLGPAAEQYLVIKELQAAETVAPIAHEERAVWGLISGEIGRWKPDPEKAEMIEFPWAKVIRIKDDQGTVLDRSIALLEAYLEFLKGGAQADVQSQLEQLYLQRVQVEEAPDQSAESGETGISDQDLAKSYAELGQSHRQQGNRDEAVQAYQQAVELQPGRAWYHMLLGNSLVEAGRPREALAAYEQVLALNPDYEQNAWYHTWVGRAYRADGDPDRAIQAYERALALEENNAEAIKWLERLRP